MCYLTTHSTHFILRLYGVGQMVKDHSDLQKGIFLCTIAIDRNGIGYFYYMFCDKDTAFYIFQMLIIGVQ